MVKSFICPYCMACIWLQVGRPTFGVDLPDEEISGTPGARQNFHPESANSTLYQVIDKHRQVGPDKASNSTPGAKQSFDLMSAESTLYQVNDNQCFSDRQIDLVMAKAVLSVVNSFRQVNNLQPLGIDLAMMDMAIDQAQYIADGDLDVLKEEAYRFKSGNIAFDEACTKNWTCGAVVYPFKGGGIDAFFTEWGTFFETGHPQADGLGYALRESTTGVTAQVVMMRINPHLGKPWCEEFICSDVKDWMMAWDMLTTYNIVRQVTKVTDIDEFKEYLPLGMDGTMMNMARDQAQYIAEQDLDVNLNISFEFQNGNNATQEACCRGWFCDATMLPFKGAGVNLFLRNPWVPGHGQADGFGYALRESGNVTAQVVMMRVNPAPGMDHCGQLKDCQAELEAQCPSE